MVKCVLRWLHFKAHEWQHINDRPLRLTCGGYAHARTLEPHTWCGSSRSFPESFSGCHTVVNRERYRRCQSIFFFQTIIIITAIVSYQCDLVAENNAAKFEAQDENDGRWGGK